FPLEHDRGFSPRELSLDDTACIMFTSGTTGEPKPVILTHKNLIASATSSAFRLGVNPRDRWLICLPMYRMGGLSPVVRSTLYGTSAVVQEGFDPHEVIDNISDHGITAISLVPTMLRRMLDTNREINNSLR
ncbi:MAG: AMP-binding protein, partial [Halobacteria archaeon]|nr:AMP-binding protein [Halobacteria archaeon]